MNRKQILISLSLVVSIFLCAPLYAEDEAVTSPEDQLQALASTRFHFITLKQFHTALFNYVGRSIQFSDGNLLNRGLNQFLSSAERETTLLNALRDNDAVEIEFLNSAEELSDVPASLKVKPLLDQPIAFQLTLTQGNQNHLYDVDWAGNIKIQK